MVNKKKLTESVKALLGLLPAICAVLLICLLPIIHNIYLSFTNYSLYRYNQYDFIGFNNYIQIFGSSIRNFTGLLLWTLFYAFIVQLLSFFIGVILAVMLDNGNIKLRRFYRTLLIIPWAMPAFVTLLMWRGLLNYTYGAINGFLAVFNLNPIPWLSDPIWARISVILISIWYSVPFLMVISLGVLQSIPTELYEAAEIDGANEVYSFKRITLPLLLQSLVPILILGIFNNFNNFGIYFITKGEPISGSIRNPGATDLLITYIFKLAFTTKSYGMAAAYSVVIFSIMAVFVLMYIRISKRTTMNML